MRDVIVDLFDRLGRTPDPSLVHAELARRNEGPFPEMTVLTEWTGAAPSGSLVPGYLEEIRADAVSAGCLADAAEIVEAARRADLGAIRVVADRLASRVGSPADTAARGTLPVAVDWGNLRDGTRVEDDWLVEDLWPARRAISVVADRKKGKSHLMLWVVTCLARGVDPWTGAPRPPVKVSYFDYEMTEDDIYERAYDEFGLTPGDLTGLRYYLLPNLPPLDTKEGGRALMATARADGAEAVVFDTFGRAVEGPEDQADTIRAFYTHTAMPLKAAGIATARLDHMGHTEKNRARGSSSKGEDIDVAWVLTRDAGTGITLDHKGVTRLRWIPQTLSLIYLEGPPGHYRRTAERWPAGTHECAVTLDNLGVPLEATSTEAVNALQAAGHNTRRQVVQKALKWRRQQPGTDPGTATPEPTPGTDTARTP